MRLKCSVTSLQTDNIGLAALLETRIEAWDNGVPHGYAQPILVCTSVCVKKKHGTYMLFN